MTGQQLKNSILQMAVQGKLVPQDPNDEPASVLLERIRAEKEQLIKEGKIKKEKNPSVIFRGADNLPYEKVGKNEPVCIADEVPFDIPESWEWVRLKTLTYNHGQKKPTSKFCYIDIGSIDNKHQKLNEQETIVVPEKAASRARKIVNEGDILYSTVRPYLHNMCIINREFSREAIASTGFAVLKCCADYSNEFLFYYMMSPDFDSYANDTANSKGVAYPAINDERLSMALVPIPPVSEQRRILKQLLEILPTIQMYDITHQRLEKLTSTSGHRRPINPIWVPSRILSSRTSAICRCKSSSLTIWKICMPLSAKRPAASIMRAKSRCFRKNSSSSFSPARPSTRYTACCGQRSNMRWSGVSSSKAPFRWTALKSQFKSVPSGMQTRCGPHLPAWRTRFCIWQSILRWWAHCVRAKSLV